MVTLLSKSNFLAGLQCPKLLWTRVNAAERFPPLDEAARFILAEGHRVGDLAKALYPEGVEVPLGDETTTARLLPERKPIFEASFQAEWRTVRVDLLVPAGGDTWDLIEVKSASEINNSYLWDVAYQYDCLTRAEIPLNRIFVLFMNKDYVRHGPLDLQELFIKQDVSTETRKLAEQVEEQFEQFQQILAGADPNTPIGPHCRNCDLKSSCWAMLPPHPVTELYRNKRQAWNWLKSGVQSITELPPGGLNDKHLVQKQTVASGEPYINPKAIRQWLDQLTYPLWHLDFETISPAIPLHDGMRPYQRVPFQFSLHVQDRPGAEPRQVEYLAESAEDPRPGLLEALRAIGPEGSVLAYYMAFEKGVLNELGRDFPDYRPMTDDLCARMSDLIVPFQQFALYHPDQCGSCSLKKTLPSWTSLTYEGMIIADGLKASQDFFRVMHGDAMEEEKAAVLAALRVYCRQDTLAMVVLLGVLEKLA